MNWMDAHQEYEYLRQLRWRERQTMDEIGKQAIRCFNLYGGTIETRDHPAYVRYLAAWKKRSRVIENLTKQMTTIQRLWS